MNNRRLSVLLASDGNRSRWNEYLEGKKGLPPLSRYEWKYILEESYGITMFPIMAADEMQNIRGILPVYIVKNYAGQSMLFSLKFGLIADTVEVVEALHNKLKDLMNELNVIDATITSGYTPFDFAGSSVINKTVILEISNSEETMWNALRTKTRNMIRKAKKEGISIERGKQNLEEFYHVYTERMLQKGVRIHSIKYFQNIFKWLGDNAELFVARSAGKIIGGMLLVFFNSTGAYIYGGSVIDRGASPNQLLLWEMIKFCVENNISSLDMGESAEGSGVHNFKIWAGGVPKDIYYYNIYRGKPAKQSLITNPLAYCSGTILRLSSHLIMKHGFTSMKRRVGLWKRLKGPLQ